MSHGVHVGLYNDIPSHPRQDPRLKAMFSRLAGADGEIDADELQDMLTASLSKGNLHRAKKCSFLNKMHSVRLFKSSQDCRLTIQSVKQLTVTFI